MRRAFVFRSLLLAFALTATAADWPQWRGPNRDGISKETGLLQEWPKGGPPVRWKITDLGTGYSSPAIAQGKVYIQTTRDNEEFTVALDEKTGKQIWSTKIGKVGVNKGPQYPGTRSTPTVDGKLMYSLASDGELTCLDTEGSVKWQKNLVKDFGGKVGAWAYSESVLVDGDKVICTPGGEKATLAALNKLTGETIWKSEVPGGDIADYASIMAVQSGDRKQYVQYLRNALVGVDAKTGAFLWKDNSTQDMGASILTPVVKGDTVFVAGSRKGGALFQLKSEGDGVVAKQVYFEKAVAPSIGGAVLVDGLLYGAAGTTIFCADFATGKVKWSERSVGPSSVCYADGRLYFRGHSTGTVVLVEPSPEAYKEVGRLEQPDRSKIQAWAHPVVANGGLYLSDQKTLVCYDISAKK
jgi:outer membrane protein assembly factor BamB